MKKWIILCFISFSFPFAAISQYDYAIGLRSGETTGITLKVPVKSLKLEGLFGFLENGYSITVVAEEYIPVFQGREFQFYYGGGGHFVKYNADFNPERGSLWYRQPLTDTNHSLGAGIDLILGFEYAFANLPFALSLDLKPYFEFLDNGGRALSADPGFGIKFSW